MEKHQQQSALWYCVITFAFVVLLQTAPAALLTLEPVIPDALPLG